jgi:hypothetical protein
MPLMPMVIIILYLLTPLRWATAERPSHLIPGAVLAPDLPPPGWVAVHLQDYMNNRLAYAEPCRTAAVVDELQHLSKQVDHDQELGNTARAQLQYAVVQGYSSARRHTDTAIDTLALLDKDIATIDGLFVRLSSLPDCENATAASPTPGPEPPNQPPQTAATSPAAPSSEPSPPVSPTERAVTAPSTSLAGSDDSVPQAQDDDVFVVRFDNKLTGLTPTSIRTLKGALKALSEGRKVQIAIEGCQASDSAPAGVVCLERTRRLKRILSDDGVSHPAELIAKPG